MDKKNNLVFTKIKSKLSIIVPSFALIAILGATGYLVWQNHNDFENAMVRQVQTQLLVTALSEAQSLEKKVGFFPISTAEINSLVKHINDVEKSYTIIINGDAKIMYHPYESYIGKNLLLLIKGKITDSDWLKLQSVAQKIRNEEQGSEMLNFLSEDFNPKIVKTLIAYAPIRINKNKDSIVVATEYDVIAGPIHKNTRENLIFMGFISLVLVVFGSIFYRIQREKDKLAMSEAISSIINKQLRLEIEERKKAGKAIGRGKA